MKCYFHPEADAVVTCAECGKAICQSCSVNVSGKTYCQQCFDSSVATAGSGAARASPTNPLAVISLALGILGPLGCLCGGSLGLLLFGILAAITGWIARNQISQRQNNRQGVSLATVGLVLGIAEVVLSIVITVLVGTTYGCALLSGLLSERP